MMSIKKGQREEKVGEKERENEEELESERERESEREMLKHISCFAMQYSNVFTPLEQRDISISFHHQDDDDFHSFSFSLSLSAFFLSFFLLSLFLTLKFFFHSFSCSPFRVHWTVTDPFYLLNNS